MRTNFFNGLKVSGLTLTIQSSPARAPESRYSLQHKEPSQRKPVTPARSILAPVTLRMIPINSCDGKNRLNAAGYKYTFFEVGNISALRGYYFH
jgi:hypothetical protein